MLKGVHHAFLEHDAQKSLFLAIFRDKILALSGLWTLKFTFPSDTTLSTFFIAPVSLAYRS